MPSGCGAAGRAGASPAGPVTWVTTVAPTASAPSFVTQVLMRTVAESGVTSGVVMYVPHGATWTGLVTVSQT